MTSVVTEPVELAVSGMTCAACAARIERRLNRLDGVHATVNYATERANVRLPPDLTTDDAIATVRAAGYDARVRQDATEDHAAATTRDLRRRLVVAALLAIPLGNLSITLALVPGLRFPGWEALCVLLATPVVGYSALPFHRAAWRNLRHGGASMDTLVSIGVLASFCWALWSVFAGAGEPGYWRGGREQARRVQHPTIFVDGKRFTPSGNQFTEVDRQLRDLIDERLG